ncbi:MAG TPA: hypothetical protein VF011_00755 [Terriglobales bacterium]
MKKAIRIVVLMVGLFTTFAAVAAPVHSPAPDGNPFPSGRFAPDGNPFPSGR